MWEGGREEGGMDDDIITSATPGHDYSLHNFFLRTVTHKILYFFIIFNGLYCKSVKVKPK